VEPNGKEKKSDSHCPYCTKELMPEAIKCPNCLTTYGNETILITKSLVSEALKGFDEVPREYDRVPKRFKITYSSPEALEKCYISDIGKGGIFVKTEKPLKKDEKVSLKLFLPDGGKELEVMGAVAWSSGKKHRTPLGEYPPGMGIRFLNISPEDKGRIQRVLKQPKP